MGDAAALAQVAAVCARDVGQPLAVTTRVRRAIRESLVTLYLPAAIAATQRQIWCLACRLACFCPGTRVSVLVQGEFALAPIASAGRKPRLPSHRTAA